MYSHTQTNPWQAFFFIMPAMATVAAWFLRSEPAVFAGAIVMSGLLLIVACSFQSLTVFDNGDHLRVRFGPIGLFGSRIYYRDITSAKAGLTALIDGWGIHYVPFRGWTMNLFGFECVKIAKGARVLRIGSDDSENLARFLTERISSSVS